MPILFIPMGIPGCGKSTWGERMGITTVSSDAIRAEMGDVYDQSRNAEVFEEFHFRINGLLKAGFDVYADATNLSTQARDNLRLIALGRPGVQTHVVLFRNLGQAIMRNAKRDRVVPSEAMLHMIEKYEKAVVDIAHEGYDHVTEVSATR